MYEELNSTETDIAIIGMSGRFPQAPNLKAFWHSIQDGAVGSTELSEESLRAALHQSLGYVPEELLTRWLQDPLYVRRSFSLEHIDRFDAAFFGYSASEAELLDPQHRLFLECAWETMEDAGYDPEQYSGLIGVFTSAEPSTYHHMLHTSILPADRDFLTLLGNQTDYLPAQVAHKLNCKGPSFSIQSACSSSLTALHVACQSLRAGECDMALVGGVVAYATQNVGYHYTEGGLSSPDGHCRPFDSQAQGTVLALGGVGVVLLKPLAEAIEEGDNIHALIKSSAINNDGALRTGFAAPSIRGQMRVVAEALAVAEVEPESIRYLEAHGTGTPLGDAIEVSALTQAFRRKTKKKQFCALGSLKANFGHLGAASGIAAVLKAALALEQKVVPPLAQFSSPNPQLNLPESPFFIPTAPQPWEEKEYPRRTGIHSVGIGGSNAHMILEEAPSWHPEPSRRSLYLLPLSARTPSSLETATRQLLTCLKEPAQHDLADIAYTLQVGRRHFAHRRIVRCHTHEEAIAALERPTPDLAGQVQEAPQVAFLFPESSPATSFDIPLYKSEPVYQECVDTCLAFLRSRFELDLRTFLPPNTQYHARLVSFVQTYALARLWLSRGLQPVAMAGEQHGEYVAACLSATLTLEEALTLLVLYDRSEALLQAARAIPARPPTIPYVSSLTGTWVTGTGNAVTWLHQPGQSFAQSIRTLHQKADTLFVGIAPQEPLQIRPALSLHLANDLEAMGRLWLAGCPVRWNTLYLQEQRRRVSLPTYPFERERYWIYPPRSSNLTETQSGTQVQQPRPPLSTAYVAPRNEIEQTLTTIWQALFKLETIGIHDSFQELGGHSLLAMRLAARIRDAFPFDFPLSTIFTMSTIAELSEYIENQLLQKVESLSEAEAQQLIQNMSRS
uniref:Uncharacterized protein n=1 Tax=Thermosporothrix sp. COM3 TaxID=2490863 RepID=A0A455SKC0_9CHLR|nr:hypothetical protein KTC_28210 [Thermosporothrix sp. COM3]